MNYVYSKKHPGCHPGVLPVPARYGTLLKLTRLLITFRFSSEKSLFDTPPLPKPPYGLEKAAPQQLTAAIHFEDCGFFHALRTGRSED